MIRVLNSRSCSRFSQTIKPKLQILNNQPTRIIKNGIFTERRQETQLKYGNHSNEEEHDKCNLIKVQPQAADDHKRNATRVLEPSYNPAHALLNLAVIWLIW